MRKFGSFLAGYRFVDILIKSPKSVEFFYLYNMGYAFDGEEKDLTRSTLRKI